MNSLLFLAQAATEAAPQQPNAFVQLMPLVFIIVIFYFLMIRPQQKRQKQHQALVNALKTGDSVVTSSGIHGIIVNVKDRTVLVKVADNVKIEFDRAAIATVEKTDSSEDAKA